MDVLAKAILATLSARPAAALLTTPTCHLFTSGPTPITSAAVTTDFVEATFHGYAAVVLGAFLGPITLPNGEGWGVHVEADFLATSPFSPPGENIQGYWIDDGATTLYYAERFPTPIPISAVGDFISLDVIWGQPTALAVA